MDILKASKEFTYRSGLNLGHNQPGKL